MRRIGLIVNPTSGRGQGGKLADTLRDALLTSLPTGSTVEMARTEHPRHAEALATEFVHAGIRELAVAGGDGTLHEALNGVPSLSNVRIGVLPVGTGNDVSRTLGFGPDWKRAILAIANETTRKMDVGLVRPTAAPERRWLNVCGVGFDAAVAQRINEGFRSLRGTSAYLAAVVQTLQRYQAQTIGLETDAGTQTIDAMLLAVANCTCYGGGMKVAPDARYDDGLFDLVAVQKVSKFEFLRAFPRVFKGTHLSHPAVLHQRAARCTIRSASPLPILVDGELWGTTPVEFSFHNEQIEVFAP